jgi:LuxR family transcriptional regulator, maltose regulon positive regulatory protein
MHRHELAIPSGSRVTTSLIASKMHPPRLPPRHVLRPRLTDQLNEDPNRRLCLICAPAGSGKSTLLCEWSSNSDMPMGWISLDEDDNDLGVFLGYILAAVQSLFPTFPLRTLDLVRSATLPPVEILAASLNNDLDQIDSDFTLLLDDYHVITNPDIDRLLLPLLRHPPRGLHLAVATRVEPAWTIQTLRARGQVTELRFDDLRFTAEESEAFLRKALGDALEADFSAVLHEETEGWAAGLHLMTLVARHEGGRERILSERGAAKDIGAFLLEEVFAHQSPTVQDRLVQISILERFSSSLCEAVCGDHSNSEEPAAWGRAFLEEIDHLNLFLIGLDGHNEYFRLHHLFRRFLNDRLHERMEPPQIAALHRRASAWFAARGLIEEALDHALTAGDEETAAELVARHRHELYDKEQFARLTRWLRLLPVSAKEHNPEILLAEARVATMNWRFTEAAVFMDQAERELAHAPERYERQRVAVGELAALRAILDLWAGDSELLLARSRHALALLPTEAGHLRGLAHMGVVAAHWQRGERDRAWGYLNEELSATRPQLPMYGTLLQSAAFLHWLDNDLTDLLVTARRLLAVSQELDLPDHEALAHYFIGTVHYARNDLQEARTELALAAAARFNMRLLWWSQSAGMLALTEQALGLPEQARQTLNDAFDFLLERHAVRILPNLDAFHAELERFGGRLMEAKTWASHVEPGPLTWTPAVLEPRVVQARAFLAQEGATDTDRAAALIAELREFCGRVPNRWLSMEVEAVAVLLDLRRDVPEEALARLHRLVVDAAAEGRVRLFVDLGEPMERLLRHLAAQRIEPQTVGRILAAFPTADRAMGPESQNGLVEPLSERELEVLALLEGRESNKEIAAQLFIAASTVKRHTLNIYRKLEVGDRRMAVARARELGLVPPR